MQKYFKNLTMHIRLGVVSIAEREENLEIRQDLCDDTTQTQPILGEIRG